MGWATLYIADLKAGLTVKFRPHGNSMRPKVESGQLCTVAPVEREQREPQIHLNEDSPGIEDTVTVMLIPIKSLAVSYCLRCGRQQIERHENGPPIRTVAPCRVIERPSYPIPRPPALRPT